MKIIAGGVGKVAVGKTLESIKRPEDTVIVSTDMDAAMKLRTGAVDYYFGTCHTGAGASLGVLVGLLGSDKCHTFGRSIPSEAAIDNAVDRGAVAFGFSIDQIDSVVPALYKAIVAKTESK